MRITKIAFLFIVFATASVKAQSPTPIPPLPTDYRGPVSTSNSPSPRPGQISGGVLNGKAKSLPKPQYPEAARAVRASGPVTVQVLIDENGAVISASAVSGHPLLRAAAAEAARGALFSPTLLQGQPVKVSGVITYNFLLPVSLAHIGFAVVQAQSTGSFGDYLTVGGIKNSLPREWEEERKMLDSLTFETVQKPVPVASPPAHKSDRFTVLSNSGAAQQEILDSGSREAIKEFSELLSARVDGSEIGRWNFQFGKALGALFIEAGDSLKFEERVLAIEVLAVATPIADTQLADDVRKFVIMARAAITNGSLIPEVKEEAVKLSRLTYR